MNVRNHIHLTGNLGTDPKTVVLKTGKTATEFSLATNEYYRDKQGERQTRTEWHRVKAYGKLAELFDQHLQCGSPISIVGTMRYRRWVDKFEQTRTSAEVIAEEFTFLGGSRKNKEEAMIEDAHEAMMVAEPVAKKTSSRRKKTAARPKTPTADIGEVIQAVEELES
ncbi:single-stranded DNA-binding protein [Neolewinella aurantiaca]|uniref:Single-stranded DNA-binding protein n=1 Tax=Neolewinella aurantiaca TaxID=2602767 RepID=A0A5C7FHK4_9BACT|nr:single-stranded DNA-binding protein [Neolewinella aurantiaca]TXF90597.1 single-stranded DNA-binding protein [Neolewinella aurantiaca]